LFDLVDTRQVKASKTQSYQIDVFARFAEITWICECKYTKKKMGMKQVKKLESAARALILEAKELNALKPKIQLWLVSTGGFTNRVLSYVKDRDDIYVSDYDGINGIFRFYGGNYQIPIFRTS
jgi:Holliday junction resolvase